MEPIQHNLPLFAPPEQKLSAVPRAEEAFGDILGQLVQNGSNSQQEVDRSIQTLHSGGEKNLHEAVISLEKADIALRYMVQVRNKALEAYQEIMRIQI